MKKTELEIPVSLREEHKSSPVYYITTEDSRKDRISRFPAEQVDKALRDALADTAEHIEDPGQCLVKVHIGEPKCATRMRPEYTVSSRAVFEEKGASGVVAGDTTVAYTGRRGHKQNPPGKCKDYLKLAHKHGWARDKAAGMDFVVLDRPETSVADAFTFEKEHVTESLTGLNRYREIFKAGGFEAADTVINHAHLTLHGLAGVAGCIKSIAMGCASLKGKYVMHKSMLPRFDDEKCTRCGACVSGCPENAIELADDRTHPPVVAQQFCIGCGECVAVCPSDAVELHGREISDWVLGRDTLPTRMVDYAVGLMNGKWDRTVHVLHLYGVTEKCDCVDIKQRPMIHRDMGFLVGRNPFAIDLIAARLLARELRLDEVDIEDAVLRTAAISAEYAYENYDILPEARVEKIFL